MLCFCMNWTPATLHVSRNPFRCRTSEKSPHNSNHCHTSKTAVFKPCVCHTSEPPGVHSSNLGTYHSPAKPQVLSFHTLAHSFALAKITTSLFSSDSALFAKNHPGWGYPSSIAF